MVWKLIWLSRTVSISWASIRGAVTRRRGSFDVAREAEAGEVVQELLVEQIERAQVLELLGAVAELAQDLERRSQARGQKPVPLRRQAAREELEDRLVVHVAPEIAGRHRELVEVDEKRGSGRVEQAGIVRAREVHCVFLPDKQATSRRGRPWPSIAARGGRAARAGSPTPALMGPGAYAPICEPSSASSAAIATIVPTSPPATQPAI
jgi:hypothetical protein